MPAARAHWVVCAVWCVRRAARREWCVVCAQRRAASIMHRLLKLLCSPRRAVTVCIRLVFFPYLSSSYCKANYVLQLTHSGDAGSERSLAQRFTGWILDLKNHLADKKRSRAVVLSCVHELAYLGVFERLRGSEIGRGCAVRKRSRAVCKVARAV